MGDIAKEKKKFIEGIEQLKKEGYRPQQPQDVANQITEAKLVGKSDFLRQMATSLATGVPNEALKVIKTVDKLAESVEVGGTIDAPIATRTAPRQQRNQPVQPQVSARQPSMYDLPRGVQYTDPQDFEAPIQEAVQGRERDEDDEYFDRMVQQRMANTAKTQPQAPQRAQGSKPVATQPIYEQYLQQPQMQPQPIYINEQVIAEMANKAMKDAITNMLIEEKVKKVITEGLADANIRKVVIKVIQELSEINKQKKQAK